MLVCQICALFFDLLIFGSMQTRHVNPKMLCLTICVLRSVSSWRSTVSAPNMRFPSVSPTARFDSAECPPYIRYRSAVLRLGDELPCPSRVVILTSLAGSGDGLARGGLESARTAGDQAKLWVASGHREPQRLLKSSKHLFDCCEGGDLWRLMRMTTKMMELRVMLARFRDCDERGIQKLGVTAVCCYCSCCCCWQCGAQVRPKRLYLCLCVCA